MEKGTTFHYAWLILIIAMLVWKEPGEAQFPQVSIDTCKVSRYDSMWFTAKKSRTQENQIFFVMYHMDLHMLVN